MKADSEATDLAKVELSLTRKNRRHVRLAAQIFGNVHLSHFLLLHKIGEYLLRRGFGGRKMVPFFVGPRRRAFRHSGVQAFGCLEPENLKA